MSSKKKLILIVEDDPVLRVLLEKTFLNHGYECIFAEHGAAAQETLKARQPDLIIVDLLMPVMDGLKFIQWLKKENCNSYPILIFTTVEDPKIKQKAAALGVDLFISKPIHPKELLNHVEQLFSKASHDKGVA